MWNQYREAVNDVLPDVPIVVDKFHVIKEVNHALDEIRKHVCKGLETKPRKSLKNNRWLLLSNSEDLDFEHQLALRQLLENYPQFMEPHGLKEEFRSIYRKKTRWEAEAAYAEWEAKALKYAEFQALITSVRNWWNEIFAYFDHRYTNAATESLNRVINEIGRAGRGYSFDVLRVKVLFRSKASKPAKYRFPERNPFPARAGTFGFVFIPRQRKELVHGAGVDLQMLEKSLKDGSFWESV